MPFKVSEELQVEVKNQPGAMAKVLRAVADAGVEVRAFVGYAMGGNGFVHLVPSDAKKAKAALKKAGYKSKSNKVVVGTTKDKRGAAAAVAEKVGLKGINLEAAYATGTGMGMGVVVLSAGKAAPRTAKALGGK